MTPSPKPRTLELPLNFSRNQEAIEGLVRGQQFGLIWTQIRGKTGSAQGTGCGNSKEVNLKRIRGWIGERFGSRFWSRKGPLLCRENRRPNCSLKWLPICTCKTSPDPPPKTSCSRPSFVGAWQALSRTLPKPGWRRCPRGAQVSRRSEERRVGKEGRSR